MVPKVGLEPTRPLSRGILNPLRLPFRHLGPLPVSAEATGADVLLCHVTIVQREYASFATELPRRDLDHTRPAMVVDAKEKGSGGMRRLYDWMLRMAEHPNALWVLAVIAFAEASVFPIPPDVLMIPMIIARPRRAWLIASIAMVASVSGGLLGYAIGALAFDSLGEPILTAMGKADSMAQFNEAFVDAGFWAVLGAGITPFPFKVITIMAGWTGMPLATFIITAVIARGIRFYLVATLLWYFGAPIRAFIEQRLGLVFTVFFIVLIGAFFLIRFI